MNVLTVATLKQGRYVARPAQSCVDRVRHSPLVQLNHVRWATVGSLRTINALQQSGSDVPVLPAFGDNCNRLLVVACEHANQKRPAFRLKRNTITDPELEHLGMGSHVIQEFQPLNNPARRS